MRTIPLLLVKAVRPFIISHYFVAVGIQWFVLLSFLSVLRAYVTHVFSSLPIGLLHLPRFPLMKTRQSTEANLDCWACRTATKAHRLILSCSSLFPHIPFSIFFLNSLYIESNTRCSVVTAYCYIVFIRNLVSQVWAKTKFLCGQSLRKKLNSWQWTHDTV